MKFLSCSLAFLAVGAVSCRTEDDSKININNNFSAKNMTSTFQSLQSSKSLLGITDIKLMSKLARLATVSYDYGSNTDTKNNSMQELENRNQMEMSLLLQTIEKKTRLLQALKACDSKPVHERTAIKSCIDGVVNEYVAFFGKMKLNQKNIAFLPLYSLIQSELNEETKRCEVMGQDMKKKHDVIKNTFGEHQIFADGEIFGGCSVESVFFRNGSQPSGMMIFCPRGHHRGENGVYFVFTGTASVWDIPADANIWAASGDPISGMGQGLNIHKGFFEYVEETASQFMNDFVELMKKHDNISGITFTGHSLGAGMASIAAYHIKKVILENLISQFPEKGKYYSTIMVDLLTFASPRVFDFKSARQVEAVLGKENIIRVWNYRDMVASLPPGFTNSKHVGLSVVLEDDLFKNFSERFKGQLPHHAVKRYFNLIASQASNVEKQLNLHRDFSQKYAYIDGLSKELEKNQKNVDLSKSTVQVNTEKLFDEIYNVYEKMKAICSNLEKDSYVKKNCSSEYKNEWDSLASTLATLVSQNPSLAKRLEVFKKDETPTQPDVKTTTAELKAYFRDYNSESAALAEKLNKTDSGKVSSWNILKLAHGALFGYATESN